MNNKVIEVLDYVGEKLGIAVDWTADNVWPQVVDILGRYRTLQLVTNICWLIVMMVVIGIFIKLWIIAINSYKVCINQKEDSFWWYWSNYWSEVKWSGSFGLAMFSAFLGIPVVVGLPFVISDIFKWLLIPEIQFLELFSNYLSKVG